MQETPGASGRGGMSAKAIAKDHARQFPDVLYKSGSFAPCAMLCWNTNNTFSMAKAHLGNG